jgi:hypothetical protein
MSTGDLLCPLYVDSSRPVSAQRRSSASENDRPPSTKRKYQEVTSVEPSQSRVRFRSALIDLHGLQLCHLLQGKPLDPLLVALIPATDVKAEIASAAARTPLSWAPWAVE